jgi:hypothetical protein
MPGRLHPVTAAGGCCGQAATGVVMAATSERAQRIRVAAASGVLAVVGRAGGHATADCAVGLQAETDRGEELVPVGW